MSNFGDKIFQNLNRNERSSRCLATKQISYVCCMFWRSDENHILPMKEIISRLSDEYGISPDRRTIYSLIATLKELGYDISGYDENGVGYYLRQRMLELSEIRLLMDAVYSFPFITPKNTEDLVEKLQEHLSIYERKRFKNLMLSKPYIKTSNRQVFWSIEQLDTAITKKVKVRFKYLCYNLDKQLVPRRSEVYTVNPYGMVFTNENYYLICIKENKDNVSLYRIDRMRDIEVTDSELDPRGKDFDPQKFVEQAVYAYTGEPEPIVMHCNREIIDHIIDKYGTDIDITELDDAKVKVRFTVPPNGVKFWALQFLPHVEVVSPQWLRDEIIECISQNPYMQ